MAADDASGRAAGIFSEGADNPAAGVFSKGTEGPAAVVDVSLPVLSVSVGGVPLACCEGVPSIFPRMIGRPSLALPMITTFEFVDCDSCSVASMPRQRRYESEIP